MHTRSQHRKADLYNLSLIAVPSQIVHGVALKKSGVFHQFSGPVPEHGAAAGGGEGVVVTLRRRRILEGG